ncbi:GDSL esterase/lipase [Canna indica]|uniref:GDSL esterase/lipase n=1 Tax=Canna indica TaxID=4628 RepID=A0AAQ3KZS3_9LILI|nr:GDSL esterase/lipase [Canna indica]
MLDSHSRTITISFFFLLLPTAFFPLTYASPAPSPRLFSKIYAFGDSFTDTGNTHSTTGPYSFGYVSEPPYGTTFFHRSTNRYSDGRLVVDFLATTLSLPFLPPYLSRAADFSHGVNFAVAGSTAIDHDFYVKNNVTIDITPQSLMTELMWFDKYLEEKGCKERGSPKCRALTEDALFWVGEIGANDYAYSYTSSVPHNVIQQLAIKNAINFVEALLLRGAKYVVVQGLPLIGCLPLTLILAPSDDRDDMGCSASINRQTYNHNEILQNKLNELRKKYPQAIVSYADYFAAYHTVMKNPAAYGFSEPLKACCGSGGGPYNFDIFATCGSRNVSKACSEPNKYINWDGVHLTEAMYKVVSDMFFHRGYCKPPFQVILTAKGRVKQNIYD